MVPSAVSSRGWQAFGSGNGLGYARRIDCEHDRYRGINEMVD